MSADLHNDLGRKDRRRGTKRKKMVGKEKGKTEKQMMNIKDFIMKLNVRKKTKW